MKFENRLEHGRTTQDGLTVNKFSYHDNEGRLAAGIDVGEDGSEHHWVTWPVVKGRKMFDALTVARAIGLLKEQGGL